MVEPNANAVVPGSDDPADFYPAFADTLADWNRLTPWLTRAVRDVDANTPILISPLGYGAIAWLPYLKPTGDERTVYRVNQYEPRRYVLAEGGPDDPNRLSFPGTFDQSRDGISGPFDRAWLDRLLQPLDAFAGRARRPAGGGDVRRPALAGGYRRLHRQPDGAVRAARAESRLMVVAAGGRELDGDRRARVSAMAPTQSNTSQPTAMLLAVVRADWQRNTVRPSPA